jgi:hypothetical protein
MGVLHSIDWSFSSGLNGDKKECYLHPIIFDPNIDLKNVIELLQSSGRQV